MLEVKSAYRYALYVIIVIAIIYITIGFVQRASFRRNEYKYRVFKLNVWHDKLAEYFKLRAVLPDTLYEYCVETGNVFYTKVSITQSEGESLEGILDDPLVFKKEVQYELLKSGDRWYIKEKNGGFFYIPSVS